MPIVSTVDGTTMPAGTDAFNPNVQLKAYQDSAAKYNKFRIYADPTARDADTYATEGWRCYVISTKMDYRHNGISWDVAGPIDSGWITLTTTNSWTAASFAPQYRKIGGIVHLQGRITGGSTGVAFTLPAGFRPINDRYVAVNNSSTIGAFTTLSIKSDGTVTAQSGTVPFLSQLGPFPADN